MNEVQRILLSRAKKIRISYHDFLNNPFDEVHVHKLRVNTRKLRGVLNVLKKALYKEDYIRLNSALKNIAMMVSHLRDIDVMNESAGRIARANPERSEHYQEMFFYLKEKRDEEMKSVLEKVSEEKTASKIDQIESKVATLQFKKKYSGDDNLKQFLNKRLSRKYQRLIDDYEAKDINNYSQIHEIRKDAKKLRFGARYLGKLTELNYKLISKDANKIQDELGDITDRHVKEQLLHEFADSTDNKDLQKLFLSIMDLEEEK
ncbi:CHAD domain-containing protein [Salinicoccus sp. YB14-2]|uniref:CHAD domain-containing protein n=1 Tax=Salinicoccus sp. YB14-2 TaxID=1572701 RepID=UPI000692506A|nr:CHAD domain-containing protein [Salinicoccus sp. YB14-2]